MILGRDRSRFLHLACASCGGLRADNLIRKKHGQDFLPRFQYIIVMLCLGIVNCAIADGQLPSNGGAGYVIRRILRRAIRYAFTFLGQKEPFIYKLVATLAQQMGGAFPELDKQYELIKNVIKEEENSFLRTLEQGLLMLDTMMNNAIEKVISGSKAFELYDTYGFPIDLTALILTEKGFILDEKGFEEELQKQKERFRAAAQMKTDDWVVLREDDEEEFIGYDALEGIVRVTKYRKVESQKDGTLYHLVFNVTPFYPEGGGQVGDKGLLVSANSDVQRDRKSVV